MGTADSTVDGLVIELVCIVPDMTGDVQILLVDTGKLFNVAAVRCIALSRS
jgi:hypothetical protein